LTSYSDTQRTPDPSDPFAAWLNPVPTEYSLWLACPPAGGIGYVEVAPDSGNPTRFEVRCIPAAVRPVAVAQHIASLLWTVMPDVLDWDTVRDLRPGTVIRSKRFGLSVVDTTGKHHLGWLNPTPPVALTAVAPAVADLRVIDGTVLDAPRDIGSAAEIFGRYLDQLQVSDSRGPHDLRGVDDWRIVSLDGEQIAELHLRAGTTTVHVDMYQRDVRPRLCDA
jgi:hypothetical protein